MLNIIGKSLLPSLIIKMTQTETTAKDNQTIELAPSYKIPICLIILAIPLALIKIWIGGVITLLGLFLLVQTRTIRLHFTPTALEVLRSEKILRQFPYEEWLTWRIFWQPVPILFYFREINSIHFLPIIFDPKTLLGCLQKYCPRES